ncbi:MoaD/ThiS family protein [uncultured Spirosoma sp.]|uniref:MoaD/ThiS family protein n=1 Tax=uncultured Spirosoma sp. TaxID=278208 RepID=UPI00258B536C|nr:MoaD/ThiS family protein [uncultured Spirosoma sp.]
MNTQISVLLFGITRDLTGQSAVTLPLTEGARVSDLLESVHAQFPDLARIRSMMVAVNGEYAEPDLALSSSDEVALIPPVSGG